ncbi:MAG: protoporphyrinogen oxidase [Deltaproteobacteria bacterium]|nr:protoporphyrinogen oxidase [Deltaproteobacteria bacterium]
MVGAGISGLAAAHRVVELAPEVEVSVLEASDRVGGVILTENVDGFVLDVGPDSFITEKPEALALCKRLGLEARLQPTRAQFRRTLIVRDGKLHSMPEAFQLLAPGRLGPFLRSSVLSWSGRLAALKDLVLPRGGPPESGDESLASFVRRRLGQETLERIAQPMVGGIYTADPETLSLRSTMPRFLDMEREHRSVILALLRKRTQTAGDDASGARFGLFLSLRGGIGELAATLASKLPAGAVRRNAAVTRVDRCGDDGWTVELASGAVETAEAVILATPAPRTAKILSALDPTLSARLAEIDYASTAIVSLAFRLEDVPSPPKAFGVVVPFVEGRSIIAASFSSVKYEGRAPENRLLVRTFVGGALQPELLERDDANLLRLVRSELRDLLGIRGEPVFERVHRWPASMPQYRVGHGARVTQIEKLALLHPGLALAGNAYHGVGLADCVRSGESAGERALAHVRSSHETALRASHTGT